MATRLSCFSLISAIESDLRAYLEDSFAAGGLPTFMSAATREVAQERQKKDTGSSESAQSSEFSLLDYLDFGHLGELIFAHSAILPSATREEALGAARRLQDLLPIRNRVCHSRPLEFDDFSKLHDFATEQSAASQFPWLLTRSALRSLSADATSPLHIAIPEYWDAADADIFNNVPAPDFEDTGFIGRKKDVENVKRLILGAYPVISIIGEGGVGKTSLALRVLYDLLESGGRERFDAIVWTSLKTAVLTPAGVQDLRGAISDTLGMYSAVAGGLGAPRGPIESTGALLREISDYLRELRVLVALDNLETIQQEEIIAFLRDLPAGSKVLITSRIGLGQLEHPYPLAAFEQKDAASLLRRAAMSQNLRELHTASAPTVERWCKNLGNSPLAIKWFVASVALGRDPADLLNRGSKDYQQLLRFSFENLFKSLSPLGRTIVSAIHVVGSPLTKTDLALLLEALSRATNVDEVEFQLRSLVNASVLQRTMTKDEGYVSRYKLGGFAQQFLSYVQAPDRQFVASVQAARKRQRESIEESTKRSSYYKYDQFAIHWRHKDERTVSPKLLHALEMSRAGRFRPALEAVDSALQMLPQFAEIRRVRAIVLRDSRDFVGAREEYEACLELDSESHIGRYAFAQFLVTELEDCDTALSVLAPLLATNPADLPPKSIAALARQRLGQLREAASMYEELLRQLDSAKPRVRIAIRDQAAETYRRLSDLDAKDRDEKQYREHITRALEIILECVTSEGGADPKSHRRLNEILQGTLAHALRTHDRGLAEVAFGMVRQAWDRLPLRLDANPPPSRLLQEFGDMPDCTWFAETVYAQDVDSVSRISDQPVASAPERRRGVIFSISTSGPYGFIKDIDGRNWFFHRSHMYDSNSWGVVQIGSQVEFAVGTNQKGECAIAVKLTT